MQLPSILLSSGLAASAVAAACAAAPLLLRSDTAQGTTSLVPCAPVRGGVEPGPGVAGHGSEARLLMRATTPAEARQVVRYCRDATPADSAALHAAALGSADPLVAGNAARALGRVGALGNETDRLRLVSDPRLRVRQDAVIGLGLSGDPAVLDVLEPLLDSGDPSLTPLVLRAIGRIGGSRAGKLLEARLRAETATEVERAFAAEALRSLRTVE